MIDIKSIITRINALLGDDTSQSVIYAALEARLALEKVCYDRLRQRHSYISHAQLRKWQPSNIVKTLIVEVDPHVAETVILHIGKNPDVRPEDDDYVKVGIEIGFDPNRLANMWNALANLALHVALPKNKDDHIPEYGDKEKIREKVKEVVVELERLSKGTMTYSGFGPEVSFDCLCGEKNRRRVELLRDRQRLRCINFDCKETWEAIKEEDGFHFKRLCVTVNCEKCKAPSQIPWQILDDLRHDQFCLFSCQSCQHENYIVLRLMHVRPSDKT